MSDTQQEYAFDNSKKNKEIIWRGEGSMDRINENNKVDTVVYAGRLKNESNLMKSSSGGAFTALSDVFLNKGDAVACAVYDTDLHSTVFRLITSVQERDAARGSKYMQSNPADIYKVCLQWLLDHPKNRLLFVGMGCQAEGFRKYAELTGIRTRVFIVDIICHGGTSPKIWREYAEKLERQGKIEYLTFKDKRNGWRKPTALAIVNGKEILLKDYIKVFYNGCTMRPSCHKCPYAKLKRNTDITIGDYWHIEEKMPDFYSPMGNSLFLIHTNKGMQLFEEAKGSLEYRKSNTVDCWQNMLERPTPKSEKREIFWKDYQQRGIEYIMKKYGTEPLRNKVKSRIKKVIGRLSISKRKAKTQ